MSTKKTATENGATIIEMNANSIVEKLNVQLAEITRKKKLVDDRAIFLTKKGALEEIVKELKSENGFDQSKIKISIYASLNGYREEEKATISNQELILYFIELLTVKIDEFVEKIETDLIG